MSYRYCIYNQLHNGVSFAKPKKLSVSESFEGQLFNVDSQSLMLPLNSNPKCYWSKNNNAYIILFDEFELMLSKPHKKNTVKFTDSFFKENITNSISSSYLIFPKIIPIGIDSEQYWLFTDFNWLNYCYELKQISFFDFCFLKKADMDKYILASFFKRKIDEKGVFHGENVDMILKLTEYKHGTSNLINPVAVMNTFNLWSKDGEVILSGYIASDKKEKNIDILIKIFSKYKIKQE